MDSKSNTIDSLRSAISNIESSGSRKARKPRANRKDETVASDGRLSADSAFKKIVELVNLQERSSNQLRVKLQKASYSQEQIEEAIDRAQSCGIVDDMRYAQILIRSRISQSCGSVGIEKELRNEHIDIDDVPGWPYDFPVSYDEELERALGLLERKPTHSKNLRDGAFRKLMGKGYGSNVAAQAARMWVEDVTRQREDY